MQQAYLSPISQDIDGLYGIAGAWHHELQTAYPGVLYTGGEIATDPDTGLPTEEALLVYVDVEPTQHAEIAKKLIALPVLPLDTRACDIPLALRYSIEAIFGTVPGVWDGTWREVLNYYGRLNNPDFNADDFT